MQYQPVTLCISRNASSTWFNATLMYTFNTSCSVPCNTNTKDNTQPLVKLCNVIKQYTRLHLLVGVIDTFNQSYQRLVTLCNAPVLYVYWQSMPLCVWLVPSTIVFSQTVVILCNIMGYWFVIPILCTIPSLCNNLQFITIEIFGFGLLHLA